MSESSDAARPERDRPWVMRTYAGHSSAAASNALYRRNLDKGQTGLSVAFDLPTQTGYDPDHVLARGEVGKVGVPISHIGDMRALFADIPLSRMNTSMTINATAMWLLALYQVAAEEQAQEAGEDPASAVRALAGTTQNDIIKEYLSRGTYVFAPGAVAAADHRHGRLHRRRDPEVEPDQHLQLPPAGGRRDAGAGDRLRDVHRDRRAGCRARLRPGASRALRRGRGPHLVLRQRRRALRRGDVQDARLRAALGRADPRALRRHRRQAAALPLRRAGELARAHRGPAREQRAAHRARDARRDDEQGRPGPRGAAARVERGARPAPARGTSSGRCASSRCWPSRATCSSTTTSSRARRSSRPRSPSSSRVPGPRSTGCRRWVGPCRPSRAAT